MAWSEDPTVFLVDFGVPVTAGATSGLGILDQPGALVADGMVVSTDYTLRCEASKFGSLLYGDAITVDGQLYEVREVLTVDDGLFCLIQMTKQLTSALVRLLLENGSDLLLENGSAILLEAA